MEGKIVFLAVFLSLEQMDLIYTAPVIDCDKYKYKVLHQYQPYCMACLICPTNVDSKHHNAACKTKIPHSIPGQGYAWCTGVTDKAPWCPQLTVQHGKLVCPKGNDVYSTCKLQCDLGYVPENSSWTEPKCLESLHWSIPDQSILRCQRAAKPDKPSVTSLGQRQEVKAGSDKTLQCIPASDTVGKQKVYWYFKHKQLYTDSDLDIYVIHGTSKDSEGEYFCQVEDAIGRSELSAGYFLKVEEIPSKYQTQVELISAVLPAVFGLVILCFLYWKRAKIYTCSLAAWHGITMRQHQEENETMDSCLSSVASSVGGCSQSSGTTGTTDGSSDRDSTSPLLTVATDKIQELPQFIVEANKVEPLDAKLMLISGKEISDRNNRVSILPLTSELKDPALTDAVKDSALTDPKMNTFHGSCTSSDKTIGTGRANITGVSSKDQHCLRLVFKDYKLMKRILTLLDQKAEVNQDKPTFHCLGRYLGDSPDEVSHFEFRCQHKELSPTEAYIKRMTEEGQGLSNLLTFLKQHKHTLELAEEIENKMFHHYHASVD